MLPAAPVDGLLVTSPARTVLDLAARRTFRFAVVAADAALRADRFGRIRPLTTKDELRRVWQQRMPFAAHVRAAAVIGFAEPGAESPLESVSRVTMRQIGTPRARLQVPYRDEDGFIGWVDFDWPEFGVVGEADGAAKYLDSAQRAGRTAEQVVLEEKRRDDRLRVLPRTVVRWSWADANDPAALARRLTRAGLPLGIRN